MTSSWEKKERGHNCLFESQNESDDGRRDADKIFDLPHELHAWPNRGHLVDD